MGIVTSDLVKALTAGLRTDFMQAYTRRLEGSVIGQIATVVETTLPTQDYGWLSSNPKMREFVDERVIKALKENSYTITDKTWEATLGVSRRSLEDDQYGMIRLRVNDLAQEAARHREQITIEKFALGATTVCADGQFLVDTDHNESGTNQVNKSTNALSESELQTAISNMGQFTDDQGVPMGIMPTHLLVGPKLQWTARKLLESVELIGARTDSAATPQGSKNVLQGALQLVVSPYLTGAYDDYWFVIDASRPVRPVILQERSDVPVEFAALDDPNTSEAAFMRDQFNYGVRARYEVGFGLWQLVYGGIL